MSLRALTIDLEGVLRDRQSGSVVEAKAIGEPVNVSLPLPRDRKGEFTTRVLHAILGSDRYEAFERELLTDGFFLRSPIGLREATGYVIGPPASSHQEGKYLIPIQFYREIK